MTSNYSKFNFRMSLFYDFLLIWGQISIFQINGNPDIQLILKIIPMWLKIWFQVGSILWNLLISGQISYFIILWQPWKSADVLIIFCDIIFDLRWGLFYEISWFKAIFRIFVFFGPLNGPPGLSPDFENNFFLCNFLF